MKLLFQDILFIHSDACILLFVSIPVEVVLVPSKSQTSANDLSCASWLVGEVDHVCSDSVGVAAYDSESGHPGSNPEWGAIYYEASITAQGLPEPSSLSG